MLKIIVPIFLILLIGCTNKLSLINKLSNNTTVVDFCDLPEHTGEIVYIKGIFSGIDEYWAMNAEKRCKNQINVELDYYKDGAPIPAKFQKLFDSVFSNYWNICLIIEATGKYENNNPNGYGHLGSNKSRFIVKEFINVKLIKKGGHHP